MAPTLRNIWCVEVDEVYREFMVKVAIYTEQLKEIFIYLTWELGMQ